MPTHKTSPRLSRSLPSASAMPKGYATAGARGPELVVCCRGSSGVIGVCFASTEQEADEVGLRGIAVDSAHAGLGIGSQLLERFESAVRQSGYVRIGVGSAHGYVERFYLAHGYEQTEFMVTMPPGVPRPTATDELRSSSHTRTPKA